MHDRAPDHRPLGPRPQRFPGTPGNAESPPKKTPKMPTPRHVTTQMPKVKDKARILKSGRRKAVSYLRGATRWTGASFIQRRFAGQKGWAQNLRCNENPGGQAATLRPRLAISAGRPPTLRRAPPNASPSRCEPGLDAHYRNYNCMDFHV